MMVEAREAAAGTAASGSSAGAGAAAPKGASAPTPAAAPSSVTLAPPPTFLPSSPPLKRRAYFQVGSGGTLFLLVSALFFGGALYTQNNLMFWAFGLLVGGLLVSILAAWVMMAGVRVARLLPGHGVVGEAMVIRYRLENRGWLPIFGLVIHEDWGCGLLRLRQGGPLAEQPPRLRERPFGWALHIGPRQTAHGEAVAWPARRGPLRFQRIVMWTSFPFGILRRVVEFDTGGEVLVYPHLYRLSRRVLHRLAKADPAGRQRLENVSGGHEEFYGLREYRPGDSLKTIDWKRTARTGDLISREMHASSAPKVVVALDLSHAAAPPPKLPRRGRLGAWLRAADAAPPAKARAPGPAGASGNGAIDPAAELEAALSLAASVICDAHFRGYQVGLGVLGIKGGAVFTPRHSVPHRTRILEALARLEFTGPAPGARALPESPTVVIRPAQGHGGNGSERAAGAFVLTTDRMGELVREMEGGSEALLGRAAELRLRRQELREGRR